MNLRTLCAALILAGSLAGATGQPSIAANCPDFASQAAAQAHLRANPSDPDGLDANKNGIACEDSGLPGPTDFNPVARTAAPLAPLGSPGRLCVFDGRPVPNECVAGGSVFPPSTGDAGLR